MIKFLGIGGGDFDIWYEVDGVEYGISYDAKNHCIKPDSLMDEEGGLMEFSYHPDAREVFDKIIEFNATKNHKH